MSNHERRKGRKLDVAIAILSVIIAGKVCEIINNGANTLQIFPASGDNAGGGVDTGVTLAAGSNVRYITYNATNWVIIS